MPKKKQASDQALPAAQPLAKTDVVVGLLRRAGGATLADITDATSWLPHTSRAMLTGLRKKGWSIAKEKVDGLTRYSISAEPAA